LFLLVSIRMLKDLNTDFIGVLIVRIAKFEIIA